MASVVKSRNLTACLDAMRGRDAIYRAIAEEGSTPARQAALLQAEARVQLACGRLSGAEFWRLRQELRGDGNKR